MSITRLAFIGLLGGLALGASACTDRYGYSGVSIGAGPGVYGGPGFGGPGLAGAPGYYGWYDNFYYPGTGSFVYDQARRRHRWNAAQRGYWQSRRAGMNRRALRSNWSGFGRDTRRSRPVRGRRSR